MIISKDGLMINGCLGAMITGIKFFLASEDEVYGETDRLVELTYRLKDVPDKVGTAEIMDLMPFTWEMNSRFVRTLEFIERMPIKNCDFDPVALLGSPVEVFVRTEIIEEKLVSKIMDVRSKRD